MATLPLAFGMVLPVQAQSVLMAEAWESGGEVDDIVAVARACEAAGFHNVSVCDHVAIPRGLAATMHTTWFDPVATLSYLAALTTEVKLLSQVYVLSYRHPLQVAKSFATLDALSRGRMILGVGVGHVREEFEALGVEFSTRGQRADEMIAQIRARFRDEWGGGDLAQRPLPVQQGGPPIWVGGSSSAARRRAATLGDGWLPQGPPKGGLAAAITEIHALRDKAGRAGEPFAMGAMTALYVGEPPFDAGPCVSGEPERLAEHLAGLAAIGVTHVQVHFRSRHCTELVEQVAAFGDCVVPLLGGSPESRTSAQSRGHC